MEHDGELASKSTPNVIAIAKLMLVGGKAPILYFCASTSSQCKIVSIFAVIGTPRGGSQLTSRLELQEGGELLSTHRDTFRGEALASAIDPPESVRRQRQRITCIPQGNNNGYANFQML